jgi:peptide/nickel transport system substrate-binding protein
VTWDPHGADVNQTVNGQNQVYERLLDVGSRLDVRPGLAVSWQLAAPDLWRFELRPEVRFHDGSPLTVEDVVFSLERALGAGSEFRRQLSTVVGVRAAGPSTLEVRTHQPDPSLPITLRFVGIMSARWAREHGVADATPYHRDTGTYARAHAMGTGPFRLETAEAGGAAVLVRNPDWWGLREWPHPIDRIIWTPVPDGHERAAALLRGDVDFASDLPPEEVGRLRAAAGVLLTEVPEMRVYYIGFHQGLEEVPGSDVKGRNPFRDRRVREAVYRAINAEELIARAEAGLAVPAGMLSAPGINGWSEELDRRIPYDPDGARRLLAEAGYPGGFAVPLLCRPSHEVACRVVAEQLARVGLRAEPDIRPAEEYHGMIDGEKTGFLLGSVGTAFDAHYIFRNFYHTQGWPEAKGYATPELDALVDAVGAELSSAIRDALIEQVWQRVMPDVSVVPLYRRKLLTGTRDWIEVPVSPFARVAFREARLTRLPAR